MSTIPKARHNTKEAFLWIVSVLRKRRIPFEITGGLAAELYGSRRPLADIDIDISEKRFEDILPDVRRYVVYGPARYRDKHWRLLLLTLRYRRQLIDLCGFEHMRVFDHGRKRWIHPKLNFSRRVWKSFFGVRVPVESKRELLVYKKELWRRVDRMDVGQLTRVVPRK